MKNFRDIFSLIFIFVGFNQVFAVPAMREIQTIVQPDGKTIEIIKVGDEHRHFTVTNENVLLHLDSDGFYRLGRMDERGMVVSTGITLDDVSASIHATKLKDIDPGLHAVPGGGNRRAPQSGMGLTSTTYPRTGSPKGLIILVEYADVSFMTPDAENYFHELINGENFTLYDGTGSALEYFTDQSHGQFIPSFDVLGPVTLPQNREYYGGNNGYGNDKNAHRMVIDAINILDPEVDFSQYDTDNDGVIDNVYLFYAGQGEADYGGPDTVWPHSTDLRLMGIDMEVDGVKLAKYACSNEWGKDTPCGIGTFVHEFSHVLGLPDLYATNGTYSDYTPGKYSVLDQGPYNNSGYTPPNFNAFELNALGWFEPVVVTEPETLTLDNISSGEFALIPTHIDTEFFLIENRQLSGWDSYIPGHGMLVWHIDYKENIFQNNAANNDRSHPNVDILEANNNLSSPAGFTFPGVSGKTSLTSSTVPALTAWDGTGIDLPITDIVERTGMITFDVAGGGFKLGTPEPKISEWSAENGYFIVKWETIEGATDYLVNVYANDGTTLESISTGFDNEELPEGWNASAVTWNNTTNNYGDFSPSYKFGKDGQILRTPKTETGISSIEFWAKGNSCEGSYLEIEGLANGEWYLITKFTPVENDIAEIVIISENIQQATDQVRFKMVRKKGSIMIDDIVINYGDRGEVLPDYDNVSTSNLTTIKVDKIISGHQYYYVSVIATDGELTACSSILYFQLIGEAEDAWIKAVDSLEEDEGEYFNLQGLRIHEPFKGEIVIIKTPFGYKKIMITK